MLNSETKTILLVLFVSALIVGLECAKQGMPAGGPEDKTPPVVVRTHPIEGSVEVALNERIQIEFSERMDPRSLERALFISPTPGKDIPLRWHGRRVDIQLPGGLQAGRTYVVTIGADVQDVHRNRLKASYSFAFSTGPRMDQGEISGKVHEGRRGSRAHVLAYDLGLHPEPNPASDRPDYTTQTDRKGDYALSYVSPGSYRVFAFEDRDRDNVYTPGRDPLAVPPGETILSDSVRSVQLGHMKLAVRDTVGPTVLSARPLHTSAVQLRFDKEIDPSAIQVSIEGLPIRAQYGLPEESERLYLYTDPQQSGVSYTVLVEQVLDLWGNPFPGEGQVASFTGSALLDTVQPGIAAVEPEPKDLPLALDQAITLVFDEAMRIDRGTGAWIMEPGEPEIVLSWSSIHTLQIRPSDPWKEGEVYIFQADPMTLMDHAGNTLRDSLNLSFRTMRRDTLGVLSGTIQDLQPGTPGTLHLHIQGLGRRKPSYRIAISDPHALRVPFQKEILPGAYTMWVFRDRDGNHRLSLGQSVPFLPSECFVVYPDTLSIRSRWTTEGIDLKFPR